MRSVGRRRSDDSSLNPGLLDVWFRIWFYLTTFSFYFLTCQTGVTITSTSKGRCADSTNTGSWSQDSYQHQRTPYLLDRNLWKHTSAFLLFILILSWAPLLLHLNKNGFLQQVCCFVCDPPLNDSLICKTVCSKEKSLKSPGARGRQRCSLKTAQTTTTKRQIKTKPPTQSCLCFPF